jgi:TonB family protein
MKYILLIAILTLAHSLSAQEPLDSTTTNEIILVAEKGPEFPGGMDKLYEFIGSKLKYPKDAQKAEIEGRVVVSFVVERDGSIKPESIKIEKGLYPSIDKEALRVIKLMPNWIPAQQKGRTVRAKTGFPIMFALK